MLTGISGSLEMIGRRLDAGRTDGLDRYLEVASTSTQRAAALTHRLLAFARQQSLDIKAQDINALVATFRRKIAASAPEFGIRAFAENCKVVRI
jgi:signal transduction histidine kinase